MKYSLFLVPCSLLLASCGGPVQTVGGGDDVLTYQGRTDRSTPAAPKQWAPAAYLSFAFDGQGCAVDIYDELLYGDNYNYLEVVVDDLPTERVRTLAHRNQLVIGTNPLGEGALDDSVAVIKACQGLADGHHQVMVVRDTESGMGYTQITGVTASNIARWKPTGNLTIEFIGNSITSGASTYCDEIPDGQGKWFDQHRAWTAYGPVIARELEADWMLSSVSGIGLVHSCCDHTHVMPQIYDKIDLVQDQVPYDFAVKPDIVSVCLGQNDGVQDFAEFVGAYIEFLKEIKAQAPDAQLQLLSSPMADDSLRVFFREVLPAVSQQAEDDGLGKTPYYVFEKQWKGGAANHPSVDEHQEIANEVLAFMRKEVLPLVEK